MVSRTKRTPKKTQSRRKMGKRVRGGVWYDPRTWFKSSEPKTDDKTNEEPKTDDKTNEELKTAPAPTPTTTTPTTTTPTTTTPESTPASTGGWRHGKKKAKEHSVSVNHKKANSKSRSRSRSTRR